MPILSRWWFRLVAVAVVLPLAAAFATYEIFATVLSGRVSVETWKSCVSFLLLAGVAGAMVSAWRANASRGARIALAVAVALPLLLGSFLFQIRSRCPEEPMYIGKATKTEGSTCR
jgi:hypothetical protein